MDKCFICGKYIQRNSIEIKRIEPLIDNIILPGSTEKHPVCDVCGNMLTIINMINSQGSRMITNERKTESKETEERA